ncbi:hypothetical protein EVAR_63313_1 [Eumeta japonica]|uniref:Uncharacterized protein n=1 Tax=Eumeta variegata TaxID=151549 RepID=A0A4C1YL81_EUMVA|nr:hypothetical protein EVAR_63313_1 [Eumeta japonica]
MRRYAVKDRMEVLAEYLEEQFTLHPASDLCESASNHEQVERCVQEFLSSRCHRYRGTTTYPRRRQLRRSPDCPSGKPWSPTGFRL